MGSLLHDVLLDTRARSEQLLGAFKSLRGRVAADAEPFRARWEQLVRRYRGAIEGLISDPDLKNPKLAGNFYISYKELMRFLFEVEAGPLVVLSRFGDADLFVTRVLSRICGETGYPDSAPLGSAGSSQFYGALPNVDIVIVPPLESRHLLGLVDLYHELAHFVLRRRAAQFLGPFQSEIDRQFDELIEDAKRRNATRPEIAAIDANRSAWKRSWREEFAADMIATFWVGPSFGWANVRLCANMSPALFVGGPSHPADAARHVGIGIMLQRLGCGDAAEEIDGWWGELVALSKDVKPNEFELAYPTKLLEALCDFLYQECAKIGLWSWTQQDTSNNPHVGGLLDLAWKRFRSSPSGYAEYESDALEKLRKAVGMTG